MESARFVSTSQNRICELVCHLLRARSTDNEFCSTERRTGDRDRTAVCFHDLLDDVQPQTGAVNLIFDGMPATEERLEDVRLLVGGNTGAVIGNDDFDPSMVILAAADGPNADRSARSSGVLR